VKNPVSWLAAVFLLPAVVASAAQPQNLTLRDAVLRAADRNPDLAHFAFELAAQDSRIEQAGQLPPLHFNAGLDNFAGTGDSRWLTGAELTLSLSGVVELGGQAQRRVDVATRQRENIGVSRQAAQLDTLAEVARRFIHVASDQEQLQLTQLATRLAEDTLAEVTRRVEAARSPAVELSRAKIVVSRARLEQEHAEHELLTSRRKLAAMWGDREADFARVNTDLFRMPAITDFDALAEQLSSGPQFMEFASEARQRDAEMQLAMARARASVTWTVGVRRLQRDGDMALVAGFSMPLQSAQRAAPAIAEARAQKSAVLAREQAARVRAEASLYELVQELRHSIAETLLLRDEVMPRIEEAVEATEYAWERGRYSYLEWTEAQSERVELQRALIEAAANAQIFQVEIERLTGAALQSGLIANTSGEKP
jgi:cobalt-zinc-cadmium efflux system outer membrane protein